ncbi:MAG: 30S ribosomal protein S17 [Actinobacteria bacterium]|nr:30S ribosomal protein S17 [Actinomycetota bacterium]
MAEKKTTKSAAPAKRATKSATPAKSVRAPAARPAVRPAAAAKKTVARRRRAAPARDRGSASTERWRTSRRKTKVGMAVSAKQRKTVIVEVERQREHPLYGKVIRLRKRFAVHDAAAEVKAGDLVRIQESRPFSATKRWSVVEVLSRAGEAQAAAPKAADVERALEASEGSGALLAPERTEAEDAATTAQGADEAEAREE